MKIFRPARSALTAILLCAGVALTGAPSTHAANDITLIVDDFPATVRLIPGEKIQIRTTTNVTTGYSWHAYPQSDTKKGKRVAKVSRGTYAAPDNPDGMVGVTGTTTWTVTAKRPGKTSIVIATRPPGARGTGQDETIAIVNLIVMANADDGCVEVQTIVCA